LNNQATIPGGMSLKARLVRRTVFGLVLLPAVIFFCAGTLDYWQGWAFLAVAFIPPLGMTVYFYYRDSQVLERRLLTKEHVGVQKLIVSLMKLLFLSTLVLPGLDYRFGWSRTRCGSVPWWLTLLALFVLLGCHLLFFLVLQANRFAATVVQVEAGQTVSDVGPYHIVRHPMYLGGVVSLLVIPLALGSYLTLSVAVLGIPVMILRLLNEEKFLRRELPGYTGYCQRVRYRLIPSLW
jgi:protein-S-isoprenylcysteine O-methyltransferase Ste14